MSTSLAQTPGPPILFLHGDKDTLALPDEARKNFGAYGGSKQIVWFEGCGHSEGRWEQPERYNDAVDGFFTINGLIAARPAVSGGTDACLQRTDAQP